MPRTARFFRTRMEALADNVECAISHEELDGIEGGLLQIDGSKATYACDALLRWYDLHGTNPLTRQVLEIRAVHPVLTPETDLADYTRAVEALAVRRWDLVSEVDADMRALRLGHESGKRKRDDPRELIREIQRSPDWWRFSHSADKRAAMHALDLRLVGEAVKASPDCLSVAMCFLRHRSRLWRFPPEQRTHPIYLDVDDLIADIMTIINNFDPMMMGSCMREVVEDTLREYRYVSISTGLTYKATVILYAPSAVEWILGVAMPAELEARGAWWRTPHLLTTLINRISSILFFDMAVCLHYFDDEAIGSALLSFMTPTEEMFYSHFEPNVLSTDVVWPAYDWLLSDVFPHMAEDNEPKTEDELVQDIKRNHGDACPFSDEELCYAIGAALEGTLMTAYVFDREPPLQTEVTLLPSDPYENPRLLPALRYGLEHLEAI